MTDINRAKANDNQDRRVRKTRQALRDALVELILEKGYAAVTVGDIADRADVGRTTFYAHFTDKDDLLLSGFAQMHEAPLMTSGETGIARLAALARDMVTHADQERRLYRAVFGYRGAGPLQARMAGELASFLEGELGRAYRGAPPEKVTMAARMATTAFLGLIAWWLDGDEPLTGEAICQAFEAFAIPALTSMLGADDAGKERG
jgi:AcrR family transcriptional regulator